MARVNVSASWGHAATEVHQHCLATRQNLQQSPAESCADISSLHSRQAFGGSASALQMTGIAQGSKLLAVGKPFSGCAYRSAADRLVGKVISLCPLSAMNPVNSRRSRRLKPLSIRGCLLCGLLLSPLLQPCLLLLLLPLLTCPSTISQSSTTPCLLLRDLLALGAGQKNGPCPSTSHQSTPRIDISLVRSTPVSSCWVLQGSAAAGAAPAAARSCWRLLRLCLLLEPGLDQSPGLLSSPVVLLVLAVAAELQGPSGASTAAACILPRAPFDCLALPLGACCAPARLAVPTGGGCVSCCCCCCWLRCVCRSNPGICA